MDDNEERFSIGLMIGQVDMKFYITSKSTSGKRWAFFGLLTFLVALMALNLMGPQLQEWMQ